jgi:hypothetical protein
MKGARNPCRCLGTIGQGDIGQELGPEGVGRIGQGDIGQELGPEGVGMMGGSDIGHERRAGSEGDDSMPGR